MTEPTITCPGCRIEIKLTESLAAPILESARRDFKSQLAQKDADFQMKVVQLREQEAAIARDRKAIDDKVAAKIVQKRERIAADEAKKARLAMATDLDQKASEIAELQDVLKLRDAKLAQAQQAQADLLKKQRELDDARRELELTVEKRVQVGWAMNA